MLSDHLFSHIRWNCSSLTDTAALLCRSTNSPQAAVSEAGACSWVLTPWTCTPLFSSSSSCLQFYFNNFLLSHVPTPHWTSVGPKLYPSHVHFGQTRHTGNFQLMECCRSHHCTNPTYLMWNETGFQAHRTELQARGGHPEAQGCRGRVRHSQRHGWQRTSLRVLSSAKDRKSLMPHCLELHCSAPISVCGWWIGWSLCCFVCLFFGGEEKCVPYFVFKTSQGPEPCNSTSEETQKCRGQTYQELLSSSTHKQAKQCFDSPVNENNIFWEKRRRKCYRETMQSDTRQTLAKIVCCWRLKEE